MSLRGFLHDSQLQKKKKVMSTRGRSSPLCIPTYSLFFQIHDGPSVLAPQLGRVCGSVRPAPIISTQNVIYVRFRSDASLNHRGFSAQFIEGMRLAFTAGVLPLQCATHLRDVSAGVFKSMLCSIHVREGT